MRRWKMLSDTPHSIIHPAELAYFREKSGRVRAARISRNGTGVARQTPATNATCLLPIHGAHKLGTSIVLYKIYADMRTTDSRFQQSEPENLNKNNPLEPMAETGTVLGKEQVEPIRALWIRVPKGPPFGQARKTRTARRGI